ncbi:MAG: hypothetical protein JW984_15185 [Deltaproteobacteria bacterium]|uniref:Uncharacterized protein n=1 Tax=Candidatus Zymogenus saltonus TaxID=2844893 RepID=A0A9D8KH12_9DELT|nr:hypothetical protein [Candidatus Zymogenus saltonus]
MEPDIKFKVETGYKRARCCYNCEHGKMPDSNKIVIYCEHPKNDSPFLVEFNMACNQFKDLEIPACLKPELEEDKQ